jgi:hypothetical protein
MKKLLVALAVSALAFVAVEAAVPPPPKAPPLGTFGVHYCKDKVILWVLTQDGHIYRVTDDILAKADPLTLKLIKEWIASGPVDIVEMKCTVEV